MQSRTAEVIRNAALIVYDEAPMHHRHLMEALDRTLRDIMQKPDLPFGGKSILLGGDFRQVLPVIPRASKAEVIDACLHNSPLWHHFKVLSLTKNERIMRLADQVPMPLLTSYAKWVLSVGDGLTDTVDTLNNTENEPEVQSLLTLPQEYVVNVDVSDPNHVHTVIKGVYSNISDIIQWHPHQVIQYFATRAIVTPYHSDVDILNTAAQSHLTSSAITFYSADSMHHENDGIGMDMAFLNSLSDSGLAPHVLHLSLYTPVMLLRNLAPEKGLCNGTRLVITKLVQRPPHIEAVVITGPAAGSTVIIPRIKLFASDTKYSFKWSRLQFPVRPAFAMTINKSQGQTLSNAGVYLAHPCFAHGQLYVAASRVGQPGKTTYYMPALSYSATNNIVYQQGLLPAH